MNRDYFSNPTLSSIWSFFPWDNLNRVFTFYDKKKITCIECGCGCDTALYAGPIVSCSSWLTCTYSRIFCTAMDVWLTVQYCGLIALSVFWLVFVTFLYRMRCTLLNLNKFLYWDFIQEWFSQEGCLTEKFWPNRILNVRFLLDFLLYQTLQIENCIAFSRKVLKLSDLKQNLLLNNTVRTYQDFN